MNEQNDRGKQREKESVRVSVIVVYMTVARSRECVNVQGMCFS